MSELSIHNPKVFIQFSDRVRDFYSYHKEDLEKLQLTPTQARLLHFFADFEGTSQQAACQAHGISTSTMSELITILEKRHYVERRVNEKNRRMTLIYLTAEGNKVAATIADIFKTYCLSMTQDLSQAELDQFEKLLSKIIN